MSFLYVPPSRTGTGGKEPGGAGTAQCSTERRARGDLQVYYVDPAVQLKLRVASLGELPPGQQEPVS